jgi:cyclase
VSIMPSTAPRIIPVLLILDEGLNKTRQFEPWKYLGDPVNAVRIFNEKLVDELVILDIRATVDERSPRFFEIEQIAGEAFMPVGYGGGVRTVEDVQRLLAGGVEKVSLNSIVYEDISVLERAAALFGSQSLVASIDVRQTKSGERVFSHSGTRDTGFNPVEAARRVVAAGAGEIFLTSIDREGTKAGYDLELIRAVSAAVDVPVIAHGGAGRFSDFKAAVENGASAVAAGSLFVLIGRLDAVLINYPSAADIAETLGP